MTTDEQRAIAECERLRGALRHISGAIMEAFAAVRGPMDAESAAFLLRRVADYADWTINMRAEPVNANEASPLPQPNKDNPHP